MKKPISVYTIILVTLCLLLPGCSANENTTAPADKISPATIAVSIVPEQSFVKAVAGDLLDVAVMVPPGSNPENYAPTPQEMVKLSNAVIYFAIGVPTEKANILPDIHDFNPQIRVVDLPVAVARIYPEREFAPGQRDPHIWLSPSRAQVIVAAIADELSKLDPNNEDIYRANAESYQQQLEELDNRIKSSLAGLEQKSFIVYHPALGYFADDYDLKMLAIEEEGKNATAGHIQEVIDLAKKEGIKVIFYQASVSSKQADAIAEDIGGYTEQIDPLAADYIDNLQKIADTFARVLQQQR